MNQLDESINGLRRRFPEMSAYRTFSGGQFRLLIAIGVATTLALILWPLQALLALNFIFITLYVLAFLYKLNLARQSLLHPRLVEVSDVEARAIPDADLPLYTVLVPAYREANVIGQTLSAVNGLEYPHDRLEVKILLEEDDVETILAAAAARPPSYIEIVLVPSGVPRTKPKACNYGLLLSHGDLVTIFDAEDRPEPLQLRRAVAAFRKLDPAVGCLQAKLSYHNPNQNLITRWFTLEYATWFEMMLPTLANWAGPVPLGGTSMHIKRATLDEVGAWDAHNVTEDADLGIRLRRFGYDTAVLDSTTYEEANSDFINWVKQRSRWYKGYLQTWLVHMRQPSRLFRELGVQPFVAFNLILGATPLVAVVNPFFWLLALLWFAGKLPIIQELFPAWLYFPGMFCMIFGNFLVYYLGLISARSSASAELLVAVLLAPIYWLMMSVAAVKAFLQLLLAPWYWEKTTHGLDQVATTEPQLGRG